VRPCRGWPARSPLQAAPCGPPCSLRGGSDPRPRPVRGLLPSAL
jgi:hypothetical protein